MSEKICTKCGELKPLESFWRRRGVLDGRNSWCIECRKIYDRDREKRINKPEESR